MATDERKVQLGVTVDATGARQGFGDVKDSARDMAQSVAEQGAKAGSAIDSIGDGATSSAQKMTAAERSIIASIQRQTAATLAGAQAGEQAAVKGTAAYYDLLSAQKGMDPAKISPWTSALRDAEAELAAMSAALGGVDPAAQKFMQTLQSQATALKDQVATFGMNRQELLAYQAAQLGAGEAAASLIAEISQLESALKAQKDAAASASAAVNAFGETEAQASARLGDMVARSREAQAAMNATASASESAAKSTEALGRSSDDVRATIAAQNAAFSATSREMAEVSQAMEALRAGAAQSASSFSALTEQENRLQLVMASGKLSMEEYDAMLAALWKDEDRLQSQLNSLTARYDPISAATRKLAEDQAFLSDALKNGQLTTAQYEKAMAGISADQAAVQLKVLAQQEAQLEQQLKSGQISLANYKKELAGIGAQKADFSALIGQVNGASDATNHLGGSTAYARAEMLRLVNDIANGNFSRFEQTGMVLAEQYDVLGKLMTPLGLAIGGVTAAVALSAVTAVHAAESMAQYGESLTKLSQQTGISTDELQKIGYGLETVGGKSTDSGVALDTLAKKISAAQSGSKEAQATFQALGISLSDLKNLSMDQVLGKIADKFSQTADDAGKFAVSQQMFGSAAKDMIAYLDRGSAGLAELGVQAQNVGAVLDQSTIAQMNRLGEELNTIHANMGAVSMNAKTELLPVLGTITSALADVSKEGSAVGMVFDVMSGIIAGSAAVIATAILPLKVAAQSMVTTWDVVSKAVTGDFKGAKDALISGWQDEMDAGKKYVDFMKNLFYPQSVGGDGLDFGSGGGWDPKISPQKPSSNRDAGLIDKTQLQGEVQAVKDALAEELAAVSNSQKQLDALYKGGGISESAYYQQTRDNIAQTATDKINAANQDAAILAKGLNDQKLSAEQKAQIHNQIQHDQATAAKATEDFFNAIADSAAKEDEVWAKYGQSQVDAINKEADANEKQAQKLRDQADTYGLTKSALDALLVTRTQNQLAMAEEGLAMAKLNDLAPDVIANYEKMVEADKKLLKSRQDLLGAQQTDDSAQQFKKQQDDFVKTWQSTIDGVGSDFHNGFLQMLTNGKNGWASFTASLKNTFESTVVNELYKSFAKPFVVSVIANIAGMTGGNSLQNQILQNNGMAGSNLLSGGNNLINGASNLFGGLSTSSAATLANAESGDSLDNFLSLTGNSGSSPSGMSGSSTGTSVFGPSTAIGAGIGMGVGSMISGKDSAIGNSPTTAVAIGTTAGAVIGSVIPIIGTAIGAAVGGAIGGVVNKIFGSGETRTGGDYTVDDSGNISKVRGPSGGDPVATQTQQQITSTFTTIQSMASQLGGSIAALGPYSATYEVSPKHGDSFVAAGFGNLSGYAGRQDLSGVTDSSTVLTDFSLQLQRSVISGLQKANLDKPYSDYLGQFDSSTLTADQVTQIEANLTAMSQLFTAIKGMGSDFDNLKNASSAAQLSVISLAGGVSAFNTSASYFEQHFVPVSEQTTNQAKGVTDQLAKLGMSSVKTNDQFRAAVQGIDLSTVAGEQLYVQMLALAPAFDAMTTAAKQAADAQQSLWNQYFSSIYTSSQQVAMSTKQLQAQFDALGVAMPKSNADFEALVENMDTSTQPMKDLQNALLALAPAFGQLTQASSQSVSTALGNVQTAYNSQVQAINANITSISNFITSLTNLKQSLSLGSLSTLSPQDKYLAEKRLFESTSASAAAGDATAQGNLPQVAQDFLTASQAYNASSQAYVNDYNEVQKSLDANIATAQQQLSAAQQQLDATNQMVQGILDLNTTALLLSDALKAYFAAGGTTSAAAGAAAAGTYGGSAGGNLNRAQVEATAVNGLIPYSDANPYGPMGGYSVADWQASMSAGVSDAQKAAMGMTLGANGQYGWNAVNGSHAGGADYIPFDGYRAELHKGEAVVTSANNQKLSQILSGDWSRYGTSDQAALVGHIKTLNDRIAQLESTVAAGVTAQLQQSQQQHAENQAVLSKQARHLQTAADTGQQTANHTSKIAQKL